MSDAEVRALSQQCIPPIGAPMSAQDAATLRAWLRFIGEPHADEVVAFWDNTECDARVRLLAWAMDDLKSGFWTHSHGATADNTAPQEN